MVPGRLGSGFFSMVTQRASFVVDGAFEFFAQRAGVFGVDAGDEHPLFALQKFGGDFDDLLRRLARAENDFGKTLAQRAVRVHLRKAEVGHRRGLEGAQDLVAAHSARRGTFPAIEWLRSVVTSNNDGFGRRSRKFVDRRRNHQSQAVTRIQWWCRNSRFRFAKRYQTMNTLIASTINKPIWDG